MRRTYFVEKSPPRAPNGENARFVIVTFIATVTVALATLIVTLPRQVVLPAFSICALAAAACLALVASFRTGRGRRFRLEPRRRVYSCGLRCCHPRRDGSDR
ncbi:MAG: hypothetical protein WBV66_19945 [Pseudolabrys sp.]